MNVTYGIHIDAQEDRYITIAERALDGMAKAANPGAFLVDLLPFRKIFTPSRGDCLILGLLAVKHVPCVYTTHIEIKAFLTRCRSWFPGAGFKRQARFWRQAVMEMRDAPFEAVTAALVRALLACRNRTLQSLRIK